MTMNGTTVSAAVLGPEPGVWADARPAAAPYCYGARNDGGDGHVTEREGAGREWALEPTLNTVLSYSRGDH